MIEWHIEHDFVSQEYKLWCVEHSQHERRFLHLVEGRLVWERHEPGVTVMPTLVLPENVVVLLGKELNKVLDTAPHDHSHDREDYLHERNRVDKFIALLLGSRKLALDRLLSAQTETMKDE